MGEGITKVEKFIRWCENHRWISIGVIVGIVIISLANFTDALEKIYGLFKSNPPAFQSTNNVIASENFKGSTKNVGTVVAPTFNTIGNSNTINNTMVIGSVEPTIIPSLPFIKIETLDGLPEGMTNNPHFRLNRLIIENVGEVEIDNFCSRLQLPEPIAFTIETNEPSGVVIGWRPLLDTILIKGTGSRNWIGGGSTVYWMDASPCFFSTNYVGEKGTISKNGDLTGVWELTIDKLPPQRSVSVLFMTSNDKEATNYIDFVSVPLWRSPPHPSTIEDTNELRFSFEGKYQYQAGAKPEYKDFIVPLIFDSNQRKISSLGMQSDIGRWHPIFISFQ